MEMEEAPWIAGTIFQEAVAFRKVTVPGCKPRIAWTNRPTGSMRPGAVSCSMH